VVANIAQFTGKHIPTAIPVDFADETFLKQTDCLREHTIHVGRIMEISVVSDLAFVSRVLDGETAVGEELVTRLRPTVLRIVRGRVTRQADQEDLTQAVFLNVFASLQKFSGDVPLEHWASRIAVNVCLKQYRHESRRPEVRRADLQEDEEKMLDSLAASDDEIAPDQRVTAHELVTRLMDVLSTRERIVMNLIYLEGQTLEETARLTGKSNLAIRLLAFRARHKMKKAFLKLQEGGNK